MPGEDTKAAIKEIDLISKKMEMLEKKKMNIEKQTIAIVRKLDKAKDEKEERKLRSDALKSDESREQVEKELDKLHLQRMKVIEKKLG